MRKFIVIMAVVQLLGFAAYAEGIGEDLPDAGITNSQTDCPAHPDAARVPAKDTVTVVSTTTTTTVQGREVH